MTKYFLGIFCQLLAMTSAVATDQDYLIWSGGVSEKEREMAPTSGTRLVFFVSSGSYLSEIAVTIVDSAGDRLVETITTGPWLILNLPTGTYRVEATRRNGDVQSVEIEIDENANSEFGLMFPASQ